MPKPKLLLHIGHSKCGSTTIQRTLLANQDQLKEQKVFLYGRDLSSSREGSVKGMPNAVLNDAEHWKTAAEQVASVVEQAGENDTYILSAEILCQPRMAGFVAHLTEYFDSRIIHYIRPQTDWCYSAWKQWQVKRGLKLQEWVDHCSGNHLPAFWQAWENYRDTGFTPDSYSMRILNRAFLHEGDLIADFCQWAGLDPTGWTRPVEQSNPNVDHALLEVFRASESIFSNSRDNRAFDWAVKRLPEEVVKRRGGLTAAQEQQILSAHQVHNTEICAQFFSERAEDFWSLFSARKTESEDTLPEDQLRIQQLETELEGLRRVVGYLINVMVEQDKSLPSQAIMEAAVKQWRETQGIK
ncbi:hypothetical protein [Maricaulis parjimensis]|uniref:hypothetical protein n=1 Tax=Maricaulis parjimensis TaxID=144023 RepID=UPI00193A8EAE|nr:hypothetical protein [Maricaulis parjimensis]